MVGRLLAGVPGLLVVQLGGAEGHQVVGMQGPRAHVAQAGAAFDLTTVIEAGIALDRLADRADPGLDIAGPLAAAAAAHVLQQPPQGVVHHREIVAGRIAERQAALIALMHVGQVGDDAGDGADMVLEAAIGDVGRGHAVAAVGAEPDLAGSQAGRSRRAGIVVAVATAGALGSPHQHMALAAPVPRVEAEHHPVERRRRPDTGLGDLGGDQVGGDRQVRRIGRAR